MSAVVLVAFAANPVCGKGIEDLKWIEASSPNFRVRSLLSEKRTTELVEYLELFRHSVGRITNIQNLEAPIPTDIYVVRGVADIKLFGLKRGVAGVFLPRMRRNTIIVRDTRGMDENAIILHEYVHFLTRNSGQFFFPMWYSEGFAEYFSSARAIEGVFEVGRMPVHRSNTLKNRHWLKGRELLDPTEYEDFRGAEWAMFYAQSWALVHFLQNRPDRESPFGQDMATYVGLIESGTDDVEAFEQAFGLRSDLYVGEIQEYLVRTCCRYFGFPIDKLMPDFEPSVRKPTRAEMALGLAQAALGFGESKQAKKWFTVAATDEATKAQAEAGLGDVLKFADEFDLALPHFETAVELAPDDPLVHLDLAQYWQDRALSAEEDDQRFKFVKLARQSFVKAWTLDNSSPETYAHYGRSFLVGGDDNAKATSMLEEAEYLLPSNADIRLWLARAYLNGGEHHAAIESANAVLAWSHVSGGKSTAAEELIAEAREAANGAPVSEEVTE